MDFNTRKKIFLVGPMGTGKTEIALNYALSRSVTEGNRITLIDLDVIKPYFRLRELENRIEKDRIRLLIPPHPYRYADFPIITPQMEAEIIRTDSPCVIDLGGDALGARVLGRYAEALKQKSYELWYVYNQYRPMSKGLSDHRSMIEAIQKASRMEFTGIIHNSHLMHQSSPENLTDNLPEVEKTAQELAIPVVFHCIREDLYPQIKDKFPYPLLPLKIYLTPVWI